MKTKYEQVLTVLSARGHKTASADDVEMITRLCDTELTPREIADEIEEAPKRRVTKHVDKARGHLAKGLSSLAKALQPDA